jgi:lipoyl(octanoyl) transferase
MELTNTSLQESVSGHAAQPQQAATFAPAVWRLIIDDQPRSGAANMAMDQALAESAATGDSPPTLRFYRWQPPAISLGRHQPITDVDAEVVSQLGYDIVRRPTGGRAILHTDELTYAVTAAADEPRLSGTLMDAYLRLSNALLSGLQRVGLQADKAGGDVRAGPNVSAACFEVPSAYEITAHGRKLIGSAQSRRSGYVLQHGSLPLVGDIGRLVDVLALPAEERARLRTELVARACTLAQALGVEADDPSLDFQHVAGAIIEGFSELLNLSFKPAQPSAAELRRTAALIREQYANPEWLAHR